MSSKSRKSITPWTMCNECQVLFSQKDAETHVFECPPSCEKWTHNYIKDLVLYSTVELYKPSELPKNISEQESSRMVFISQSAMQICGISLDGPTILIFKDNIVIKSAWPISEKTLTSVSLTKNAMDLDKLEGPVKLQKLNFNIHLAQEMCIEYIGKYELPPLTTELHVMIKYYNEDRIFSIGNRISIPHYGRKLIFKIVGAKAIEDNNSDILSEFQKITLSENMLQGRKFYKVVYSTKWMIVDKHEELKVTKNKVRYKLEDIGGYKDLISDIQDVLHIALGRYGSLADFAISKGVLLYGPNGVGKSMIAEALLNEAKVHTVAITISELYNKSFHNIENALTSQFNEAITRAPSIVYIEDIDVLLPKKSNSDYERTLSVLIKLLDSLQNENVAVLAITSKLEAVNSSLRRSGRLDKEFEVCVPTPATRKEIIYKLLTKIQHDLTKEEINYVAFVTHGYVGADLYGLISQAVIHAIKQQPAARLDVNSNVRVQVEDINYALTVVNPTAMKEVLVEIPNVRWSDIGGQENLKLKLKQAVEWPLKHPQVFVNLGIVPPRGVLMFGPPGCSKTMIAKALATESQLNFLNIKGPELFSKWVGESEKAVREVFRKARQVAPSIIFIDEIDALGGERGSSNSNGGSSNVQERVLAQLLTELDGVTALGNVTLVAATNRPDRIDKALLRPGRLDRIIYVPLPDPKTREEIFRIKFRKMPIAGDVLVHDLVDLTEGYSGAEVQAICHEAAMKALEESLEAATITKEHFKAALSIVRPRTPPSLIKLYDDYIKTI